jgi:hypothetical protein
MAKALAKKKQPKPVPEDSEKLAAAKKALTKFLKLNPFSEIREYGKGELFRAVYKPWNDTSVAILIGFSGEDLPAVLVDALNNLILPERLTALYHKDTKTLEVIWTAYKLPPEDAGFDERRFSFLLDNKTYKCEFAKSSERLMAIAKYAMFLSVSDTGFRNLQSFTSLLRKKDDDTQHGSPLSFFVKGIEWDEEEALKVIRHLNFYLVYYDLRSPYVVIHPPKDPLNIQEKTRYIEGKFPASIVSRNLNQTLLSFWIAAYDQDIPTRFLLHYRILEFVASFHLQADQRMAFKKALSTPHLMTDIDATIDNLAGIVREDRGNDVLRFTRTFEDLVDSDRIWNEICLNPDAFTKDLSLEGGFHLKAIIANVKSKDAFGPKGMENVARALRDIRNGLAHGGQAQSGRIILPTSRNFRKLLPWCHLIATAAGEVVLYEHLT